MKLCDRWTAVHPVQVRNILRKKGERDVHALSLRVVDFGDNANMIAQATHT